MTFLLNWFLHRQLWLRWKTLWPLCRGTATASVEAYAELQALVVLWKVDMMSSLGLLITYQDNDGD